MNKGGFPRSVNKRFPNDDRIDTIPKGQTEILKKKEANITRCKGGGDNRG